MTPDYCNGLSNKIRFKINTGGEDLRGREPAHHWAESFVTFVFHENTAEHVILTGQIPNDKPEISCGFEGSCLWISAHVFEK